jgi:hypothetical protein
VSSLSGAWGLANLLYKLFHIFNQYVSLLCRDGDRRSTVGGVKFTARLADDLQPPQRPRPPRIAATITSGQLVPVPKIPIAASSTAALPTASLREQIQTERMFASPVRHFPRGGLGRFGPRGRSGAFDTILRTVNA